MKFYDWKQAVDAAYRWASVGGVRTIVKSGVEWGAYDPYITRVWYVFPLGEQINWSKRFGWEL